MIAVAAVGVIGWIAADEPIVATVCVVAADLVGAAMMVPKTYRDPESETLITFAFASLGGALAAGAVGAVDVSLLLYPAYYCVINGAIARAHLAASRDARRNTPRARRVRGGPLGVEPGLGPRLDVQRRGVGALDRRERAEPAVRAAAGAVAAGVATAVDAVGDAPAGRGQPVPAAAGVAGAGVEAVDADHAAHGRVAVGADHAAEVRPVRRT